MYELKIYIGKLEEGVIEKSQESVISKIISITCTEELNKKILSSGGSICATDQHFIITSATDVSQRFKDLPELSGRITLIHNNEVLLKSTIDDGYYSEGDDGGYYSDSEGEGYYSDSDDGGDDGGGEGGGGEGGGGEGGGGEAAAAKEEDMTALRHKAFTKCAPLIKKYSEGKASLEEAAQHLVNEYASKGIMRHAIAKAKKGEFDALLAVQGYCSKALMAFFSAQEEYIASFKAMKDFAIDHSIIGDEISEFLAEPCAPITPDLGAAGLVDDHGDTYY